MRIVSNADKLRGCKKDEYLKEIFKLSECIDLIVTVPLVLEVAMTQWTITQLQYYVMPICTQTSCVSKKEVNLLCAKINSKTHQLKCLSSQIMSAREILANTHKPANYSRIINIRRRYAYHRQQRKVLRDDNVSLGRRVCSSTQEESNHSKIVNAISCEKKKILIQKSKLKNKRDHVKSRENTELKVAKRKLEVEFRTLQKE